MVVTPLEAPALSLVPDAKESAKEQINKMDRSTIDFLFMSYLPIVVFLFVSDTFVLNPIAVYNRVIKNAIKTFCRIFRNTLIHTNAIVTVNGQTAKSSCFSCYLHPPKKTPSKILRCLTSKVAAQQMITLIPAFLRRLAYSLSIPLSVSRYLILSTQPREANNTLSNLLESASR